MVRAPQGDGFGCGPERTFAAALDSPQRCVMVALALRASIGFGIAAIKENGQ
jgi:hypothetical protein